MYHMIGLRAPTVCGCYSMKEFVGPDRLDCHILKVVQWTLPGMACTYFEPWQAVVCTQPHYESALLWTPDL